jgi:hypothetical protein
MGDAKIISSCYHFSLPGQSNKTGSSYFEYLRQFLATFFRRKNSCNKPKQRFSTKNQMTRKENLSI